MSVTRRTISDSALITENGKYRFDFDVRGMSDFSAVWETEGMEPAGVLAFSFADNPGNPPGTLNLANGDNAFCYNMCVPFVDVHVTGLPEGGQVVLYCR